MDHYMGVDQMLERVYIDISFEIILKEIQRYLKQNRSTCITKHSRVFSKLFVFRRCKDGTCTKTMHLKVRTKSNAFIESLFGLKGMG